MRDALVSSLQFSRARDAELAWVDGQLHMNVSESHMGLVLEEGEVRDEEGEEKMETDQNSKDLLETVPVLEQLPALEVYQNEYFYYGRKQMISKVFVFLRVQPILQKVSSHTCVHTHLV